MMGRSVIDIQARIAKRLHEDEATMRRLDLASAAMPALAKAIEDMHDLGLDDEQIARLLRHAADELDH